MPKKPRTLDDTIARIHKFLSTQYGEVTAVTLNFEIKSGKNGGVWHNANNGRVHVQLEDVRLGHVTLDKEPDEGEQREIDVLLYQCLVLD